MIEDNYGYLWYCFLDKKWFYTTSCRKKYKILPKAEFESDEEAEVGMPRAHSHCHAVKVMTLGLISPPVENLSDGKILLKRVGETYDHKKLTQPTDFFIL